jgi:hypothetical protein
MRVPAAFQTRRRRAKEQDEVVRPALESYAWWTMDGGPSQTTRSSAAPPYILTGGLAHDRVPAAALVDQIAVEGNPWILAAYAVTVPR